MKIYKASQSLRLSGQLRSLLPSKKRRVLTIGSLLKTLGDEGHLLLILLLSLPFCLPIPLPGVSIPFGIVIFLLSIYSVLGLEPWLPERLLKLKLNGKKATKVLFYGIWLSSKLEKVLHPRGLWLTAPGFPVRFHCLLIAAMGATLSLPLPPGTNFPPAFINVLLVLGMIERDALFICAGYLVAAITAGLVAALAIIAPDILLPIWKALCQIWGG